MDGNFARGESATENQVTAVPTLTGFLEAPADWHSP
jgi:hypothetical protein